jgi:hypothetical protein
MRKCGFFQLKSNTGKNKEGGGGKGGDKKQKQRKKQIKILKNLIAY